MICWERSFSFSIPGQFLVGFYFLLESLFTKKRVNITLAFHYCNSVLITIMTANELFYLTLVCSFTGCYFGYLPQSPLQVCRASLTRFKEFKEFWPFYFTSLSVKRIDTSVKYRGSFAGLMSRAGILHLGCEKQHMSKWVPYDFVSPLRDIYHTTPIYLGSRSHWVHISRIWLIIGWGLCYI